MSDHDSEDAKEEEEEDYDDETSEYDSENQSELQDAAAVSDLVGGGVDGRSSVMRKKKNGTSSRVSDGMDIQHRFNALRFLALNLKSQNETMKPRTANAETPNSSQGRVRLAGATF